MRILRGLNKDYYGGALMTLVGLCAAYSGSRIEVGTLSNVGPGFFPTSLGVLLAAVGVAIALGASRTEKHADAHLPFDLRACGAIIGGLVAFVVFGMYGGLAIATFALVFISAVGDRDSTLKQALWLSLGMVVIAIVVFHWALRLQLRLFPWD